MKEENVRIFSDAQAIQSERASDFDVYSAYGEVIDNSIEAEAQNFKIKFKTSIDKKRSEQINKGKNFLHIDSVAFGDDGNGMNYEILHRCLQLGYSSRYGSRNGIGRFGVGMTKGAISQCQKIEVYSKEENGQNWLYTYFDIEDVIKAKSEATITPPIAKEIPNEFKDLVGKNKGTLVIWSKIDKQEKSASEIIKESKIWIGRTFRKFIFKGIKFEIDNNEVKAIDPLYLHPEYTEFNNDPKAKDYGEEVLEWEIDDPEITKNGGPKKSKIIIRYSLLPHEFLAKGGGRTKAGNHEENKQRYIDNNEGISILRKNREVRDPAFDIPYWSPKFKEIDRWWGCEICFEPELDNWFQVKNVKRGAAPLKELREELQRRINTIRATLIKEVQSYWDSLNEPTISPKGVNVDQNHIKSTRIATDTIEDTKPKDKLSKDKEPENEIEKFIKSRFGDIPQDKANAFIDYFRNNLITILERPSNSANFFEITHFGSGKSNITYNTNHVFSNKYFEIINDLKSDESSTNNINQQQILILIDLLLIAYSMAESQFDPDANYKAEDFFEDMMRNWGRFLRDLLKTWSEYEAK
jgi:hypothetical protein